MLLPGRANTPQCLDLLCSVVLQLPCADLFCTDVLHVFSFQSFAVRSLGWVEMTEEDMAPGKSSVAVNNCIRQLSYHKHNLHDTAGIWGEVRGFHSDISLATPEKSALP